MASKQVLQATDTNFEKDVLGGSQVTLVDFWAEWCGPCRQLAPTIDAVAEEFEGRAKVYKMNVDENPATPSRYQIRGIPTVILFKNGEVVEQLVGNRPKEDYVNAIQSHL